MSNTNFQAETKLVKEIIEGSGTAENELVVKYQAGLAAMLRSRCHDSHIVDDVLQESWVVILRKLRAGGLKDSRRLSGFVTQVARNQLMMEFRKIKKNQESEGAIEHEAGDIRFDPANQVENTQLAKTMTDVLNGMSMKRDRALLLRFYHYGDSKEALCSRFELSSASFDTVLSRARERFKKSWKKYE